MLEEKVLYKESKSTFMTNLHYVMLTVDTVTTELKSVTLH